MALLRCDNRQWSNKLTCCITHDFPITCERKKVSKRRSTPGFKLNFSSTYSKLSCQINSTNISETTVYSKIIPFISQPIRQECKNKLCFNIDINNAKWALDNHLELGVGIGSSVILTSSKAILGLRNCQTDASHVAIKVFNPKECFETELEYYKRHTNELYLSCILEHDNIIHVHGTFSYQNQFHLIMEYCPTEFFKLIATKSISYCEIDLYFVQMILGVQYLHNNGIAHRDLKLDNFMVSEEGLLKLIDFGFATAERPSQGLWGSDPYIAPEVFSGNDYDPELADIWSLGIIYFSCINKRFPWDVASQEDPQFALFLVDSTPISQFIPRSSHSIILRMLNVNPSLRPTISEITSHQWFLKKLHLYYRTKLSF